MLFYLNDKKYKNIIMEYVFSLAVNALLKMCATHIVAPLFSAWSQLQVSASC